jgi:RNA exonuclease 4
MEVVKNSLSQEKNTMLALLNKMEAGTVKKIHKLSRPVDVIPQKTQTASVAFKKPQIGSTVFKPVNVNSEQKPEIQPEAEKVQSDPQLVEGKKDSHKPEIQKKIRKIARTLLPRTIETKSAFFTTLLPDASTFKKETPIIALDCEMVICTDGQKHLARVTIINYNRHVLFDEHIKPPLPVKNYLTHITNITAFQLQNSYSLEHFTPTISKILDKKIVIGHTIENDFEVLKINHDPKLVRDISLFSIFRNGKFRLSLKELTGNFLSINIQEGRHSSAEDARATLELYKLYRNEIDNEFKDSFFREARQPKTNNEALV